MVFPPIPVGNYAQLLLASQAMQSVGPYKVVDFRSGGETWFEGSGAFALPDPDSWFVVWNRHIKNEQIGPVGVRNLNPPPNVDFAKNFVVALFNGPARGVVGYRLAGSLQVGKEGLVRLVPVVDSSPQASIALPSAWAFLVLPRSKGAVSVQVAGPKGWVTVLRTPAGK